MAQAPDLLAFVRDGVDEPNFVGWDHIADGLRTADGQVTVPRVIRGKPAVTIWFNEDDAASDLRADYVIPYGQPRLVRRNSLADDSSGPASAVGDGEQAE
jgi:hypothetical protein